MPEQQDDSPAHADADRACLDNHTLQSAAAFLAAAREIQRDCGRDLRGRQWLPAETLAAADRASRDILLAGFARLGVPTEARRHLFEAFEEMCRRRHLRLPFTLRRTVYSLLTIELAINCAVLHAPAEEAIPATVTSGALHRLPEAYPEFRDTPFVYRRAAVHCCSDPEAFLQTMRQTISRLEQDERFAGFRDTPNVFRHAAANYPSDPEAYLLSLPAGHVPAEPPGLAPAGRAGATAQE